MAAGEYVSVSSQKDAEDADLARERRELADTPEEELEELTQIYVARGLDGTLAEQVARQLTSHDTLEAHARDELGISEVVAARPVQAAFASASSFAAGAIVPILVALLSQASEQSLTVAIAALIALVSLGSMGARVGGASAVSGAIRVAFWGAAPRSQD